MTASIAATHMVVTAKNAAGDDVLDDRHVRDHPPRHPVRAVHAEGQNESDEPEDGEEPQSPVTSPSDKSHAEDHEHADSQILTLRERRPLVAGEEMDRGRIEEPQVPDVAECRSRLFPG